LLVLVIALFFGGESAGQAEPSKSLVPFSDLADDFASEHGLTEIERNDAALQTLLDTGYVKIRLGVFQVWCPAESLAEKASAKEFQAIACALLDLQDRWLEWVADGETVQAAQGESKILKKWIRSWRSARASKKKERESSGPDLVAILKAKENVTATLKSYSDRLDLAGIMSPRDGEESSVLLLLSPTREDFLGLGSFIGSLNDENRRLLWHDGLALWTSFNRSRIHVIALEHPANFPGRGDITVGINMNAKEETGQLQHVVQASTELLLDFYYEKTLPQELSNGLAMCMVIALYDGNNVRAGGGSQGSQSGATSRFVRGGRSTGGKLAATSAESRWRKSKGKDHFLAVLRMAQKEGAKDSAKAWGKKRDKTAFFTLKLDKGDTGYVVKGPFLDAEAKGEPIPEEYSDEFMEFFRAYRCALTYWLMNEASALEGKATPVELLRRFFRTLASSSTGKPMNVFGKAVEEVYGRPFSVSSAGEGSLERSFLEWIAKGK